MAEIISGIYMITCNSHVYIGQSVNIKVRWYQHRKGWNMCKKDKNRKPQNRFIQNVFNKYGMDSMKLSILIEIDPKLVKRVGYIATRDLLKVLEQTYMNMHNPDLNIYGASGSPLGHKHTDEFREAKRKARLNYKHKDETKEAIRKAHLGKKKSPESTAKSALAISKDFTLYHKDMGLVTGKNLTSYARSKGFSPSSLTSVVNGSFDHCHGFFRTKEECDEYWKKYKPLSSVHRGVHLVKGKTKGKIWRGSISKKGYGKIVSYHEYELEAAEWSLIARQVYDIE